MSDQVLQELVQVLDKSFIENDLNDLCLSLRGKVQDFDCENVSNSMEPKKTRIIKIINFLSTRGKLQALLEAAIEINDAYSAEIRDIEGRLPAQESLKDKSTQRNLLKESQYVPKIFPQILKFYKEKPLRFDGSDIHYVEPEAVLLGNSTWSRTDEDILTSG